MRSLVIAAMVVACAPTVDGPIERQRAADRTDADRLATQLAQLPGAVQAEATLHRPAVDPLTQAVTPPSAAVLVVIDDKADRRAVIRSAIALVRGTAPEIPEPTIVVELGAIRPVLAQVGPFTVEARSKSAVVAAFAGVLGLVIVLAAWLAWRERWRVAR